MSKTKCGGIRNAQICQSSLAALPRTHTHIRLSYLFRVGGTGRKGVEKMENIKEEVGRYPL